MSHRTVAGKVLAVVLALALWLGGFATPLLQSGHAEAASTTSDRTASTHPTTAKQVQPAKKKPAKKATKKKKGSRKNKKSTATVKTAAAVTAAAAAVIPVAEPGDPRFCIIQKSQTSPAPFPQDNSHAAVDALAEQVARQGADQSPLPAETASIERAPEPIKLARDLKQPKRPHLNVKAAYLVNMTTGQVYYEQNADKPIPPASITKLLTLYIVREAMEKGKLSALKPIPVSARAARTSGSSMKLRKGQEVAVNELIKGISVVSANDACVAVAEYMGKGDASRFVREMNAKAHKMGMTKSVFKNPNGLPAKGQYSTARDIAKLSISYLKAFPESLSIHSMTDYSYNGRSHRNANSLLGKYEGADGLKTGFVCASGFNISATAKRDGTRLLAVVLGAQTPIIRQVETAKLLDYGFKLVEIQKKNRKPVASISTPAAKP
ncbi:D-alanyl-D-alanine carboxypeptidase [Desulfovibrio mangrovi]|uniref:D-alanyl-D-alanine carboxypeptidase family protein n=1 Tax=Desulfovibrio mangrovi TaxID=2976983 RepID=UPI002246E1CA|nr:D-alanyl-D-alanine carboxypeptidase family protein [Desulfovibrio mangrovi]UZP66878.1 D-alanyl-D-alanine carboxypeptidase [Desulfovibrio mangrovi]